MWCWPYASCLNCQSFLAPAQHPRVQRVYNACLGLSSAPQVCQQMTVADLFLITQDKKHKSWVYFDGLFCIWLNSQHKFTQLPGFYFCVPLKGKLKKNVQKTELRSRHLHTSTDWPHFFSSSWCHRKLFQMLCCHSALHVAVAAEGEFGGGCVTRKSPVTNPSRCRLLSSRLAVSLQMDLSQCFLIDGWRVLLRSHWCDF